MSWEEMVGFAGGALITVAFIPQVWRLYRLKSAREISLPFNLLFLMGGVCWLVYGISKELLSVIVSNAVNLTLVLAMLYAKMKYGRQPQICEALARMDSGMVLFQPNGHCEGSLLELRLFSNQQLEDSGPLSQSGQAGKRYDSLTHEANAQHLLIDVWTSGGVLAGVGAVALTDCARLDPIVALVVAGNIVWSGVRIVRNSVLGLMDTTLPAEEQLTLQKVLEKHTQTGVQYHALRTRQSGTRRFVSLHVLVPGIWTVQRGHRLLECIEADLRHALPNVTVFTHLESLNDPASGDDMALDRVEAAPVDTPTKSIR